MTDQPTDQPSAHEPTEADKTSFRTMFEHPKHVDVAVNWTRRAVDETAKALGATRIPRPGDDPTSVFAAHVSSPPQGLQAALHVRAAANEAVTEHLGYARGSGLTWEQIADLLPKRHHGDGYAAFRALVPEPYDPSYTRSIRWTCMSCGQRVDDLGPENGVENDERGHAENCQRHHADIAAQAAQDADDAYAADRDED